ncbi:nucleotidyltransferase [candidate division KSB1 bacterium]|nr:nucleotidyltransferase [candidate division KSB1 bacterium]
MNKSYFSEDFLDFLILLDKYSVKYLIIGGQASIFYGHARLTGDIDIFYENNNINIKKLYQALHEFWDGSIPVIQVPDELKSTGMIFQFGVPPNRIDLINNIGNVDFDNAWDTRNTVLIELNNKNIKIFYISLDLLISNKKYVQRSKDLDDLKFLLKVQQKKNGKIA